MLELSSENIRLRQLLDKDTTSGPVVAPSWKNVVANEGGGVKDVPALGPTFGRMKLETIPPVIENDRVVVSPPMDVEVLGQAKWEKWFVVLG